MQITTPDGMVRLTDTAVIMEFGPQAMKEKRAVGTRVIPYEHILSLDYKMPKMFGEGHLRIITRESQKTVKTVIDTFATRLDKKKEAEELHRALQERVQGAVYVVPPAADEPDQVDRDVTLTELGEVFKNALGSSVVFQDLTLQGHLLKQKPSKIYLPPKEWPVAKCEAHVETGAAVTARVTATRVMAGAAYGGATGALIGAIAKKDRTKVYLNIVTPDEVILKEVRGLDETKAREFANKVNKAAAAHGANPVGQDPEILAAASGTATPPPPPPAGVPAGWYPQGDVQRFWDGAAWTDHTAPLAPS
jgi:hypothetical protein